MCLILVRAPVLVELIFITSPVDAHAVLFSFTFCPDTADQSYDFNICSSITTTNDALLIDSSRVIIYGVMVCVRVWVLLQLLTLTLHCECQCSWLSISSSRRSSRWCISWQGTSSRLSIVLVFGLVLIIKNRGVSLASQDYSEPFFACTARTLRSLAVHW